MEVGMLSALLVLAGIYFVILVIEGKEYDFIKQVKSDASDFLKFIVGFIALIFLLNIPGLGDVVAIVVDVMAIALIVKDYKAFVDVLNMFKKYILEV